MTAETARIDPQQRFNLRAVTRHPSFIEYRRLALLVAAVNLWVFGSGLASGSWVSDGSFHVAAIAQVALLNFTLAILIRQQRVVNALFWVATRIPKSWPLWIRWSAGKVFHFGGLHSGGAVAGSIWFAFLLFGLVANAVSGVAGPSALTLGLSAVMVALMVCMIATAIGPIRQKFHNRFEHVHRFAGWTLLALFWAQNAAMVRDAGVPLTSSLAFWLLCVITLSIASPWMTLKKVPVEIEKPSDHAVVVRFNYGDTPFAGSSNALSLDPLREWHSFANIPTPGEDGYRLIISRAGDWTGRFIDNPPDKVWVKGITTSGVARIEVLFHKVVYVGTGSGIGPILPHLLAHDVPNKLIWSTRSPRKTYGDKLIDEIEANTEDPLIWDTDTRGKPDLSALALAAVRETGAEAVIVISNQKLTKRVIYDMERRGIPAFGAIWDS
jgi:NAD(P)H-flavin reductase